ncbi:DUF6851 domain-containing protein [Streptomyces sp. MAR4 CNX-425]|uniref:DUF6851 domain-containing protein n=1 Tax=Streptomyces sp. MAR4 CNX-425 TaxID=3406343 RepID=UPI003B5105C4
MSERSAATAGRHLSRRGLVAMGTAAAAAPLLPRGAAAADRADAAADFDFDTGNALGYIFPFIQGSLREAITPLGNDATVFVHFSSIEWAAFFDAYAPYHPTAVGLYSDLGRRPASERTTNKNGNIALFYAMHRVLNTVVPSHAGTWRDLLTSVGLDPDDDRENTTTPSGIGNLAARRVIESRVGDGMNLRGDEGGRRYHRRPYADYTGYEPVNTAYELRNPSRWQPGFTTSGNGIFRIQQFVTPQMGRARPYGPDPRRFGAPPPSDSDHRDLRAYRKQVDEVLEISAGLTDEQKMLAESFDDKFDGLNVGLGLGLRLEELDLGESVVRATTANLAMFDTLIAIFRDKRRYDAVRPFTAIRHVYGDRHVTAWGGPGEGTVTDMPASQWKSYLNTADHPEYPSASGSLCATGARIGRRFNGTDEVDITYVFPQGSSEIEPGLTPGRELTLSWDNWTDWTRQCGMSRVWGGVHFVPAVLAAEQIGPRVADQFYDFFTHRHIRGRG